MVVDNIGNTNDIVFLCNSYKRKTMKLSLPATITFFWFSLITTSGKVSVVDQV